VATAAVIHNAHGRVSGALPSLENTVTSGQLWPPVDLHSYQSITHETTMHRRATRGPTAKTRARDHTSDTSRLTCRGTEAAMDWIDASRSALIS
jgi:hypothetical protein